MIKPDYFARLTLDGLGFDAGLRHYVDWVLGLGEFGRLRQRRLGIGIQPAWASTELCAGANLNGDNGCRATVIHRVPSVCVALVHADESHPSVFWHSVAVLTRAGDALQVEHAIGRAAPAGMPLAAVATSPAVLLALLDRDGIAVTPPELRLAAPVTLGASNVPAFARSLLAAERAVPIALVAPQGGIAEIDVVRLARSLRSVAVVACLGDHAALSAFNAAVDDRDDLDLECAEQAVRLYHPMAKAAHADGHPTWLAEHIRRFPPRRRTSDLAAEIIGSISARTLPAEFFSVA